MSTRITAIVLAAGQSSRMGDQNKLLLSFNDQSMVSHVIDQLASSKAAEIIVITGNEADSVKKSIPQKVTFIHNPDYADGLSTSVRSGIDALSNDVDGVMICLGDMPYITAENYNMLIAVFEDGKIIAPVTNDKIGNPLIFSSQYFEDFLNLEGDKGARALLKKYPENILKVDLNTEAIFQDIDTPEAYNEATLLD
ncbi:MAG: nucleotidyltransferase family protein [Kordiimonadaceae bacterium]|jgi:molybdenum cofactor cytidylyltransferase|nr:nucleotidyltransferase family protein [Kordiimonadaceae bacterium]